MPEQYPSQTVPDRARSLLPLPCPILTPYLHTYTYTDMHYSVGRPVGGSELSSAGAAPRWSEIPVWGKPHKSTVGRRRISPSNGEDDRHHLPSKNMYTLTGLATLAVERPESRIKQSIATGAVAALRAQMFQALSGGHINPAVTLAYMICRRINIVTGVLYVPVQFLGCCGGCGILKLIKATMNNRDDVFPTSVYTEHGMEIWQGLVWETILAFHLCIMYLVVTDEEYPFMSFTSPLLIGTVVVVNHLAALYATGGTANPSRAISAALVSWQYFDHLWAFATGPFIGALAAGLFYIFILKEEEGEIRQRQFSIFGK